jgi:methionyl-tRNA formyltransferase
MLDTIILLTGPTEQPVLSSALRAHNSALTVQPVAALADFTSFDPQLLGRARLVAFCTDVVVPRQVLDRLGFGAYNFHPGSPQFPGWAPSHFAAQQGVTEFGATAHVMIEEVDAGPIVGVELFPIPTGATVFDLEKLAYAFLAQLFRQLANCLATRTTPFPELAIQWGGQKGTRRRFRALYEGIPLSDSHNPPSATGPKTVLTNETWLSARRCS